MCLLPVSDTSVLLLECIDTVVRGIRSLVGVVGNILSRRQSVRTLDDAITVSQVCSYVLVLLLKTALNQVYTHVHVIVQQSQTVR